ncbi:peptidase C15, pyroglutamyl peptidase I-like protein, partial [Aureobasidium melanogenum]
MDDNNGVRSVTVLVTGFGPFPRGDGTTYSKNTSHEISKLLPSILPARSQFNPTNHPIVILNPTAAEGAAVRVEYAHIRDYTSALHSSSGNADLLLHMGMADGWDFVSCERRSYKQTFTSGWAGKFLGLGRYYMIKDAAGKTVQDAGPNPWGEEVPIGLGTGLNVDDVVENAGKVLKTAFGRDVRAHEDAGTYCCGFIYYESLANKFTKQTPAEVLFCHVPGDLDRLNLHAAANSICAIIGAAAAQILENRRLDPSQNVDAVTQESVSTVSAAQKQRAMELMASGGFEA